MIRWAIAPIVLLACGSKKESDVQQPPYLPIATARPFRGSPGLAFFGADLLGQRVERKWYPGPEGSGGREQLEIRLWRPSERTRETWAEVLGAVRTTLDTRGGVLYTPAVPGADASIRLLRGGAWSPVNQTITAGIEEFGTRDTWLFAAEGQTVYLVNRSRVQRIDLDRRSPGDVVLSQSVVRFDVTMQHVVRLGATRFLALGDGVLTELDPAGGKGRSVVCPGNCVALARAEREGEYWLADADGTLRRYSWGSETPTETRKVPGQVIALAVAGPRIATVVADDETSHAIVDGKTFTAPWAGVARDRNRDAEIALSPDGKRLALQHPEHGDLVVWEIDSGKVLLSAAPDGALVP